MLTLQYIQHRGGGGGYLGGYVPLASQNPHSIIVYSVASYRPHLSHFWANVIVISRTEFNASRLLNIKIAAGTIFQPRIFLYLNSCLPEFSYSQNPENLRPHSSNSTENVTALQSVQLWKCDPIQRHIPSRLLLGSTPPGIQHWSSKGKHRKLTELMQNQRELDFTSKISFVDAHALVPLHILLL